MRGCYVGEMKSEGGGGGGGGRARGGGGMMGNGLVTRGEA